VPGREHCPQRAARVLGGRGEHGPQRTGLTLRRRPRLEDVGEHHPVQARLVGATDEAHRLDRSHLLEHRREADDLLRVAGPRAAWLRAVGAHTRPPITRAVGPTPRARSLCAHGFVSTWAMRGWAAM